MLNRCAERTTQFVEAAELRNQLVQELKDALIAQECSPADRVRNAKRK